MKPQIKFLGFRRWNCQGLGTPSLADVFFLGTFSKTGFEDSFENSFLMLSEMVVLGCSQCIFYVSKYFLDITFIFNALFSIIFHFISLFFKTISRKQAETTESSSLTQSNSTKPWLNILSSAGWNLSLYIDYWASMCQLFQSQLPFHCI